MYERVLTPPSGLHTHNANGKINNISDWQINRTGCPDGRLKMPRASIQQIKFSCSRLFNLKPYGGIKDGIVHFQSIKISGIFVASKTQRKQEQFALKSSKRYTKLRNATKVFLFKWEISLAHIKRGYSGPGMLGEFVVVLPMWCLGAPSILIICYIKYSSSLWVFKKLF